MPPRTYVTTVTRPICSPDSFWNRPLADDEPLDAASPGAVEDLVGQFNAYGCAVNTGTDFSCKVHVVPANQPLTPVHFTDEHPYAAALRDILAAGVPIPDGFEAEVIEDADQPACFYQPNWVSAGGLRGRLFEFWKLRRDPVSGVWLCDGGGRMCGVTTNPGHWVDRYVDPPDSAYPFLPDDPLKAEVYERRGWGCTATSLPLAAGVLTVEDCEQGRAAHALGIAVHRVRMVRRRDTRWPAQRNDGKYIDSLVEEGMRFRLPADQEIPDNIHPLCQLVMAVARDHGLVVWDGTGSGIAVRAEPDVLPFLGGARRSAVLRSFPWDDLQLLAVPEVTP